MATAARDASTGRAEPNGTLDALNFFLADVRDGLGPYLAIHLLAVRGRAAGGTRRRSGWC